MDYVVVCLFGVVLGLFISWFMRPKAVGNLRVDHSDPDNEYLFLELKTDLDSLKKRREVILNVRIEDYIPQK